MDEYDELKTSIYDGYFNGVEGDVSYYVSEAVASGGTVLELGCGTGRITLPIAEAGLRVVGLDASLAMLGRARSKLTHLTDEIRSRVQLVEGDMRDFNLHRRFKLIIIPYRAFMHLLTPQDQVSALMTILDHLTPSGRLTFNIYDPMKELVLMDRVEDERQFDIEFIHPLTGNRVMAWYTRNIDITHQTIEQQFYFEEHDMGGASVSQFESPLTLRYSHRYEMHYLLELCGYEVTALYGTFNRGPYMGAEQIWIATKPSTKKPP
jgi:SAM-dependent methyltransferase